MLALGLLYIPGNGPIWLFVTLAGFVGILYVSIIALHSGVGTEAGPAGGVILALGQMASETLFTIRA
jgi:hypothetical protein